MSAHVRSKFNEEVHGGVAPPLQIRSIHSERGGGDRRGREEEQRTHVLEVRRPTAGAVRLSWMLTAQMENASKDVIASVTQARPLARDLNLVLGLLMKAISCSPKSAWLG